MKKLCFGLIFLITCLWLSGQTIRVSVDSSGVEGNSTSEYPFISADGRYVTFQSWASNLVTGDTNGTCDIFVHDRSTGQTSRVSVDSVGNEGNGFSYFPSISADGRYVGFQSLANNLVAADTNGTWDIFVHDRTTGQTSRVSVDSAGNEGNNPSERSSISADGRYVAFLSGATNLVANDTNSTFDIFVHDCTTGQTDRVSVDSSGAEGNGLSNYPSISTDGRFVTFASDASNLVSNDTNGSTDIFVHDRTNGQTSRVSVDSAGNEGNGSGYNSSISADGRYVTYDSNASNLVAGDTNGSTDIFVYDRTTGQTTRVSVDSAGGEGNGDSLGPSISSDGIYIAFTSTATNLVANDTNARSDIFIHDRSTGQTSRISVASDGTQGIQGSGLPSISSDGRYAAFQSDASNLVAGDNNSDTDVFMVPVTMAPAVPTLTTLSVNSITNTTAACGGNVLSDGGTAVTARGVCWSTAANPTTADSHTIDGTGTGTFTSSITGLTPATTYHVRAYATNSAGTAYGADVTFATTVLVSNPTSRVSVDSNGVQANDYSGFFVSISADGRYVAFASSAGNLAANDTNGFSDIFVHDRYTGVTSRVSVDSAGIEANSDSGLQSISADGRYVAFISSASNLVANDTNGCSDVFVHDCNTGQTTRVSVDSAGNQGNNLPLNLSISADGRYVAFDSLATNLVPNDSNGLASDVFVHDRVTGQTTLVSVDSAGNQGDKSSYGPKISSDGRFVAFVSSATNLVVGDTNGYDDVFVHDRVTGQTVRVSVDSAWNQGNEISGFPSISADGRYVAFPSYASNLVADDTNGCMDVFVHDRNTGQTTRVSVDSVGNQGNGRSNYMSISPDGRYIAFNSLATNLAANDTNGCEDIFVHDCNTGITARVSVSSGGMQGDGDSLYPSISVNGQYAAFESDATNLVPNDTNGVRDVFVREVTIPLVTTPFVTTSSVSNITTTTASCGGNVLSDGGTAVTARGVCWSTSANPTTSGSHTTDGTGTGSFTSSISGLNPGTTYYIRAYATNSEGTGYGSVLAFTTAVATPPEISVNHSQLNFTVILSDPQVEPQTLLINNTGGGTLHWTAAPSDNWILVNPSSGTGNGVVSVSVETSGLSEADYNGTITVQDPNASNSPVTIEVLLKVFQTADDQPPLGSFDSPPDGSTVMGSVPLSGWAIDNSGVESVKISRNPAAGEGSDPIYIGDAFFVEGARPDIEALYPDYPNNYKAGWSYMLLTNSLPNQGNGTFVFTATAADRSGNETVLGTKTIICDNANAVKPFGNIDTPPPGGTASGGAFLNSGWALTPLPDTIPIDGSTITVWVDGMQLGNPVYNQYRDVIATLFPGYNNSDGAGGYYIFDTTQFQNGVHTIAWSVTDDADNTEAIGSRYFNIQNVGAAGVESGTTQTGKSIEYPDTLIYYPGPVKVKKGYKEEDEPEEVYPDDTGIINLEILELERIEIQLSNLYFNHSKNGLRPATAHYRLDGFSVTGNDLRPLPIGSTLDKKRDIFCWQPGPGFIGEYRLVFIFKAPDGNVNLKNIKVKIIPKFNREI